MAIATVFPATAGNIYTGDATGAYHSSFCPELAAALREGGLDYDCRATKGTLDNMERVATEPAAIGYGQLDVLALGARYFGGSDAFQRIRSDDVRECLFAVTRNESLDSYGALAGNAHRLRFVLPPVNSGSATTFRFLQSFDKDLALAREVVHASDTEEALRMALSAEDTVAVFVQFPDPDNPRFKLVRQLGGRFVSMLDKTILEQRLGDARVYFPQETQVAHAGWLRRGTNLVTACTPMVVFTGRTQSIANARAADEQAKAVALMRALPAERTMPRQSLFARVLKRTREISGESAERLLALSAEARERAKPMLDKAREAADGASEATRPARDKAHELGAGAYERAREGLKELIEPGGSRSKP
ncbi:MAG: hypothetical protein AB1749_03120 [Pseudomonadota bacterium]